MIRRFPEIDFMVATLQSYRCPEAMENRREMAVAITVMRLLFSQALPNQLAGPSPAGPETDNLASKGAAIWGISG